MYIGVEQFLTVVAVVTGLGSLWAVLHKSVQWVKRQKKQDEEIQRVKANNVSNNNNDRGIWLPCQTDNCTIIGNNCNNNNKYGIYAGGDNCSIIGNTCIRGTGQSSDYTSSQSTIYLDGDNCVVVGNNCAGKALTNSGTGNVVENNKS